MEIRPGAAGSAFVTAALHRPLSNSVSDLVSGGKLTAQAAERDREIRGGLFRCRRAVECASVALAAERASAEDIARLRAINRRLLDDLPVWGGRPPSPARERLREEIFRRLATCALTLPAPPRYIFIHGWQW